MTLSHPKNSLTNRTTLSKFFLIFSSLALIGMLSGCLGVPDGIKVVDKFEAPRYLGKWFEIARLDHSFERGLQEITAEYSQNSDGSLKVVNSGFNPKKNVRESAEGKAYFIGDTSVGSLKVSFFWPFYGSYNIISLDRQNYSYAMITGPDRDYLWILARMPSLPKQVLEQLVAEAKRMGFATENLIFVKQSALAQ